MKPQTIEDRLQSLEQEEPRQKKFRFPRKANSAFRQARKKRDYVVVQYLTQRYEVVWMIQPIISGNLVVIDHKPHKLKPSKMWRCGKKIWYIIREIDREPVSNMDYSKVKKRGDSTENDKILIKAVLGAVKKQSPLQSTNVWIIIAIIAVVIVVLFTFMGG